MAEDNNGEGQEREVSCSELEDVAGGGRRKLPGLDWRGGKKFPGEEWMGTRNVNAGPSLRKDGFEPLST